jgi:hypothetical protein
MGRAFEALPLWGRRPKAGGGSFGVVDPGCDRLPINPPFVGFADTSPRGGGIPE